MPRRPLSATTELDDHDIPDTLAPKTETLDQLPLNGRNLYVRIDEGRSNKKGEGGGRGDDETMVMAQGDPIPA